MKKHFTNNINAIQIILLIILHVFITISCSEDKMTNNNLWQIEEVLEIKFPLDSSKNGTPLHSYPFFNSLFDYCELDGIETLIIPVKDTNYRLAFYNVNTHKEYHSINLQKNREIANFDYINKDTIIVFYRVQEIDDKYEPLFFELLNYDGNSEICNYSIDTSNFKIEEINKRMPFSIIPTTKLVINAGKIYFQTETHSIRTIGLENRDHQNTPLFAYYDFKTKKISLSKSIIFPNEVIGQYYNTYFSKISYCLSNNNLPILRFFYSSTVYEWDEERDSIITHTLKSKIIDTIPPLKSKKSLPESLKAVYGDIIFDNENKLYYSFVYLNSIIYENNYTSLIIADSNLNYLGEIFNPAMGSDVCFFDKKIILYFFENDTIHIRYNKIEKTQKPLKPYLDSVKKILSKSQENDDINTFLQDKNPILSYINKNIKNQVSNFVLLIIHANSACTSCSEQIMEMLNNNYEVLKDCPFYLIYSGGKHDIKDIYSYKNIFNIKLLIDSTNVLKRITMEEEKFITMEPRLIIIEDNNIVSDKTYTWKKIESDLIPNLVESLGLKTKI